MAKITLMYVENEDDGMIHQQTMVLTRDGVEDVYDLLDFLSDGIRAAGYTQYERVGVATGKGSCTWSRL